MACIEKGKEVKVAISMYRQPFEFAQNWKTSSFLRGNSTHTYIHIFWIYFKFLRRVTVKSR